MPVGGCDASFGVGNTSWKEDEGCCEWQVAPDASSCASYSSGVIALTWVAGTGLCENTPHWTPGPTGHGPLEAASPYYAGAACYGPPQGSGALWSSACRCTYPEPPNVQVGWNGCQCVSHIFDPPHWGLLGCPSTSCLIHADEPGFTGASPFYGLGVRPDTGCCGEPRVWGCPGGYETARGAGGAADGNCEASDPGGDYTDNCIPKCFALPPCPPDYVRDPTTGFCVHSGQVWPAVSVTRWKEYHRVDCPGGNLWFYRGQPGFPVDFSVQITSTGNDSRPSVATDWQERTHILFARQSGGSYDVYETHSDSDGQHWTTPTVAAAGGKESAQAVNPHNGVRLVGALVGTKIQGTLFKADGTTETFNFKDTTGADLLFADDGFGLGWSPSGPEEVTAAFHISGESATSDWLSVDDGKHFRRIT